MGIERRGFERWVLAARGEMGIGRCVCVAALKGGEGEEESE